jgi:hypothetical protein
LKVPQKNVEVWFNPAFSLIWKFLSKCRVTEIPFIGIYPREMKT